MSEHPHREVEFAGCRIAAVVPCFAVRDQVLGVLEAIGPEVDRIYVVDDACPQKTGLFVEENCRDPRVTVLRHEGNRGVGAAVLTGYRQALADGAEVLVKIDGDGQMNPALVTRFVRPILAGDADYTKGNRFFNIEDVRQMPWLRFAGNAVLSFISKLASGYWDVFDPNNGFTAIHARVAALLPFDKISEGYFFESDMLFRLNTIRAVVVEVPIEARYTDEPSSLSPLGVLPMFFARHSVNFVKRIFYNYFLRSFSIASVNLVFGGFLVMAGISWGAYAWVRGMEQGQFASSGQVTLASLPIIVGTQLLLAFLAHDMSSAPRVPLHGRL
ncbi:MAG: glycosyltransferase family 2 protein [Myxococcota bacterium]|nr:glycosyl transferase family 2 [Deltaproteobacteria bacterium]MCP4239368.1 glycosyltransferase family 2 protein [bacterium]MDP6075629.1 glycosyltransferase family 2 protein [Myxococcota bacterium]MDP6242971.1 glycosyltransferase family 2 protein [Myxococcota bacterium]MDP7075373.1 glycosyltransferase family 2 protein [Myxococcota bacterium]